MFLLLWQLLTLRKSKTNCKSRVEVLKAKGRLGFSKNQVTWFFNTWSIESPKAEDRKFHKYYSVSQKKVWFTAPCTKVYFFSCNSPVWKFFNIFSIFFNFFWYSNCQKKNPRTFFSLKIKSLEKQKCVYKLFLSTFKILYRLNHRTLAEL